MPGSKAYHRQHCCTCRFLHSFSKQFGRYVCWPRPRLPPRPPFVSADARLNLSSISRSSRWPLRWPKVSTRLRGRWPRPTKKKRDRAAFPRLPLRPRPRLKQWLRMHISAIWIVNACRAAYSTQQWNTQKLSRDTDFRFSHLSRKKDDGNSAKKSLLIIQQNSRFYCITDFGHYSEWQWQ